MRMKFTFSALLCLMLGSAQVVSAQADGDYRSVATGNWSSLSTWEQYVSGAWQPAATAPNASSGRIGISNGTIVTIDAATTADQVVVESGGELTVSVAFTLADGTGTDLAVNSGGILNIGATLSSPSGLIVNAGSVNVNGGSSSVHSFTNSSAVVFTGGSFIVTNTTLLNAGTSFSGTGGTFRTNTTATVNANVTIPAGVTYEQGAELVLASGSITINGTMDWIANPIRIPITIGSTGTLNLEGGDTKVVAATITNDGTANWNTNVDVALSENGYFINNGVFNYNAPTGRSLRTSSASNNALNKAFTNNGTFNKNGAGISLSVATIPFQNAGRVTGVGTISAPTAVVTASSGTVAPGISGAGTFSVSANMLASSTNVEIQILAPGTAGVGYDELSTSEGIDLSGRQLTILDDASAPIGVYTIMVASSGSFTNTFSTVSKPSNFGPVNVSGNTVTIEKISVLPVKWGSFSLKLINERVQLNWETLSETKADYFEVERAVNGGSFLYLGRVAAKGYSNAPLQYSFTDATSNLSGTVQYRLKQVDVDGEFEYSDIRVIRLANDAVKAYVTLLTNPVRTSLKLNVHTDNVTIILSDLNGAPAKNIRVNAGQQFIDLGELKSGTYILQVWKDNEKVFTERVLKL